MLVTYLVALALILVRGPKTACVLTLLAALAVPASTLIITTDAGLFAKLDFLSYNPRYSVEDTMTDRMHQLQDVSGTWNWVRGYGFGAEFWIHDPGEEVTMKLHYIHNLFFFYLLQYGGLLTILVLLVWLWVQIQLASSYGRHNGDWDWLLAGSLGSHLAIMLNGLTILSTHSVLSGMAFGCGHVALAALAYRSSKEEDAVQARELEPSLAVSST